MFPYLFTIHLCFDSKILYQNVTYSSQSAEQANKDIELLFHDSSVTQHENNADDSIIEQQHDNTHQSQQSLSDDVGKGIDKAGINTVSPSTECITTCNDADQVSKEKQDVVVNASAGLNTDKLQPVQSTADDVVIQHDSKREKSAESVGDKDDQHSMTDNLNESKAAASQVPKDTVTRPSSITEQPKSKQQPLSNVDSNINIAHKRAKMPRVALNNQKQRSEPEKAPLPIAKKKTFSGKSRLARLTAPTISSARKNVTAHEMGSIDTKTGSQTATIAIKAARSRILGPRK